MQMVKSTPYFSVEPSSGSLMPGGSVQVMVRYSPKAMGKHSGSIPVRVLSEQGTVIQELTLELSGTSLRMGDKAPPVGGTDKLPQDFVKPKQFVDEEQVGPQGGCVGGKRGWGAGGRRLEGRWRQRVHEERWGQGGAWMGCGGQKGP